jgi:hypothetical protein
MPGVGQHAVKSLGLQPAKRPLSGVVASIITAGASTSRVVVPKLRVFCIRRAGSLSDGTRIVEP